MASALGCGGEEASVDGGAVEPPRRIVLITIDTLRADHLPFYGYPRDTTPFLAELARRSVVFDRVVAASSHTVPSHTTLFTGLHMPQHRVLMNLHSTMDPSIRTLTQMLGDAGYATIALASVAFLDVLERGFDVFVAPEDTRQDRAGLSYRPGHLMVDAAIARLSGIEPDRRVFLWLHLFDVHQPYDVDPGFSEAWSRPDEDEAMQRHWRDAQGKGPPGEERLPADAIDRQDRYDGALRFVDGELRRLYEELGVRGLLADSLWIVTSDHGEGLGSHGYQSHGREIFQEQVLVPFLVHQPEGGLRAGRVGGVWHHVDLVPTLAEILGSADPAAGATLSGVSMVPALLGRVDRSSIERVAYAQRRQRKARGRTTRFEPGPIYSLQDERTKYVLHSHGEDELYDLRADPLELENLVGRGLALETEWRRRTHAAFEALTAEAAERAVPEVSDEHREDLRALGYLE